MSGRGGGREERGRNPPSRHLWVGNLPHGISERELADRFIRFGELESLAFQPGRSYAFLNFNHDEDAFAAIESLQGFPLAGNPLRIEFAKADRSSSAIRTEGMFRHDEQRSGARGSYFVQKDSRMRYESPDTYSKPKMSDRNGEPSEVLYIGFPASMKVDDVLLRKVFSPFGEISKVTVFPGRSYAFVQFRNLIAACKAKENLEGKLFGNPRVHISFAKSEPSSSSSGRGPASGSHSPPYRSVDRLGYPQGYLEDRSYGSISRIPSNYVEDSEDYMFNRKGNSRNDGYGRPRSAHKYPEDMYTSPREMGFRDDPPHRFPSRSSGYEEEEQEDYYYQEAKRLKTRSVEAERQLEGHHHVIEQERRNFDGGELRYKQKPLNLGKRNGEALMGAYSLPAERKRYTPEVNRPSLKDWNWEGTLAKGGNPICRAKCFPVGKAMDMMLPEFVDCTARTGLEMLAKHYYQSSKAWVVFFVPGSDADIGLYNEFMHYLEEKQRAAVSKLDDTTTLFLVPPSDFSEKVLKVPGKLSISGVILRLEEHGAQQQQGDPDLLTYYGDTSASEACQRPRAILHGAESKQELLSHRYSSPQMQAFIDPPSGEEHSGFVQPKPNADPSGYHETEAPGFQPQQLTHFASSLSRQQKQVQVDNRYATQLVSSGNQNVQLQGSNSRQEEEGEDSEANPQKRLQATLQLAAALLQQIQQAKN